MILAGGRVRLGRLAIRPDQGSASSGATTWPSRTPHRPRAETTGHEVAMLDDGIELGASRERKRSGRSGDRACGPEPVARNAGAQHAINPSLTKSEFAP